MLRYCANLKAIRYESTSLNRIVADRSHRVIVAVANRLQENRTHTPSSLGSLLTFKLQLHCAIYWLRFYSNSLIHILSLSNSHNNVASTQKKRANKSHRVIVALCVKRERPLMITYSLYSENIMRYHFYLKHVRGEEQRCPS